MSILEMVLIGVALAMDASCMSIANSINYPQLRLRHLFFHALLFGFFQGIMPIIGFFSGSLFLSFLSAFTPWIVFAIFLILGGKMVLDTVFHKDDNTTRTALTTKLLLVQAVATSIDALAVGVSFCALAVPILLPALIIMVTTFALSLSASYLGRRVGLQFQKKAGLLGGGLLLLLSLKSLWNAISSL